MFRLFSEGPAEEKARKRTPIRLGMALIAVVGMLLAPLALAASASTRPHASTTVQGSYVSVTPFRIVDTRTGATDPATYAGKTLAANSTLSVQVTGVGTTPVPTGASAVVLNVTAVDPTTSGFLTVFPEGATQPLVSNLNFSKGEIVANLVTVELSAAGGISIYNQSGNTDVVVDVEGYYTSTPASNDSGLYNAISPVRVLGTLASGVAIAANTSTAVTVTGGTTGVPATASAVVANVTAAGATTPSFLTVYPAGATQPTASNLNFGIQGTNVAIANRVTVGVGTNGQIEVYNHTGSVNVDVDLDGYYSGAGGSGSVFTPITPIRVADTRTPSLVGTETPIAANTTEKFLIATTASGIPATATAVATNVTVVPAAAAGYLTVYPTSDTTNPTASDLNWVANESPAVPNFTIADTAGTGSADFYASAGASINVIVDAFGYFSSYSSGPVIVSATVTDSAITLTYNEAVSCPTTPGDASGDFQYFWTGAASGGAIVTCAPVAGSPDELTLTTGGAGFTLPGSGASIVYSAPTLPTVVNSVYETGTTTLAGSQTVDVSAAAAPKMVSAVLSGADLAITYSEDVTCLGIAYEDFVYNWTGAADATIDSCSSAGDVVTLVLSSATDYPSSTASIVYTEPTTPTTAPPNAIYATGSAPALFAPTQTLAYSAFSVPVLDSAAVSGAGIALTYSEAVSCPTTGADGDFVYDSSTGVSGASITGCTDTGGDVITLTASGGITLPGTSGAQIVYTAPASPTSGAAGNAVYATTDYPQFPATQTLALTAVPVPAMQSATVDTGVSISITYNEAVTCPAAADAAFAYDSATSTSGGTPASCTSSGGAAPYILTLDGPFLAPTATASIVYTEPATPSPTTAVFATGTSVYAVTQTLALDIPFMQSAVVSAGSIAVTYNEAVFCPTTFQNNWTYFSATEPGNTVGGVVTGCTASGDVLTLAGTGGFNAPAGTAELLYTAPGGPTAVNSVFAGSATAPITEITGSISGASITG